MSQPPLPQVLIVDDEADLLNMISETLANSPCELLLAASSEEALEILHKSDRIALIIADLRLPGEDGLTLLEKAQVLTPRAGRILMTAHPEGARAIDAVVRGTIQRFVTKPWDTQRLRRTVENYVCAGRTARQSA